MVGPTLIFVSRWSYGLNVLQGADKTDFNKVNSLFANITHSKEQFRIVAAAHKSIVGLIMPAN